MTELSRKNVDSTYRITPLPQQEIRQWRLKRITRWVAVVFYAALLILWELSSRANLIPSLFFPPPLTIARAFVDLLASGKLIGDLGATVLRLTVGFLLGGIPALLLGWAMGWLPWLRTLLDPVVAALHPVPKIAILPLILIIFGIGDASRLVIIAIAAFFPLLINTVTGVQQIDPIYFDTAKNYGLSHFRTFTQVLIPGSLPFVMTGVRLALNNALVLTITAELVMAQNGLGELIWFAWQTLQTRNLYVGLIVTAVLGILINLLLQYLTAVLIPWQAER